MSTSYLRGDINPQDLYSVEQHTRAPIKLDNNEWPYDTGHNRYPSPQPKNLLDAFARRFGVSTDNILISRGSDEAIDIIIRSLLRPGNDALVQCPPCFGMYAHYARLHGIERLDAPLKRHTQFGLDGDTVLAAVERGARLVFCCTPNNPTATSIPPDQLLQLATKIQGKAVLVVDEAYIEFSEFGSLAKSATQTENLIVLRTLSKAGGMADLRLGCAIACAEMIQCLRVALPPYPLPRPVAKMAVEAIDTQQHSPHNIREIVGRRNRLIPALRQLSFVQQVFESDANFVYLETSNDRRVHDVCRDAGIDIRYIQSRLATGLRIAVGTEDEVSNLLHRLSAAQADITGARSSFSGGQH